MSWERTTLKDFGAVALNDGPLEPNGILAVGDPKEWRRQGHPLPNDRRISFVEFSEVDKILLMQLTPSVILSPVLARGFDCIDLDYLLLL